MFKINISNKEGKTWKIEAEAPGLMGKELMNTISGSEISPDLEGYELEITGTSDKSGFPSSEEIEGIGYKKILLEYGRGMHKKPKGEKKKSTKPKGLRLRKTMRGKVISEAISQINLKIIKEGSKKLSEIFPDQNKTSEPEVKEKAPKAEESKTEEKPVKKTETKEEAPTEAKPEEEPKEKAPVEGNPEKEPKESEASKEEKANPEEEPKA